MSVVRLECERYQLKDEFIVKAGKIWPEILDKPDEKWLHLNSVIIQLEDIPDWVADCDAIRIKPIKKIKFISEEKPPNLNSFQNKEVIEFVKTVNQVVMPGYDLLEYRRIEVMEDSCTNEIQRMMNDGWRIIAVMPQKDQRRPDYILVHKEYEK